MKPTQEQVIAWAREAGLYVDEDGEILEGDGWHTQTIFVQKAMTLAYEAGRKDENEACVKVCKDLRQKISNEAKGVTVAGQLMAAIRARMAPLQRLNKAAEDNGEEL